MHVKYTLTKFKIIIYFKTVALSYTILICFLVQVVWLVFSVLSSAYTSSRVPRVKAGKVGYRL